MLARRAYMSRSRLAGRAPEEGGRKVAHRGAGQAHVPDREAEGRGVASRAGARRGSSVRTSIRGGFSPSGSIRGAVTQCVRGVTGDIIEIGGRTGDTCGRSTGRK